MGQDEEKENGKNVLERRIFVGGLCEDCTEAQLVQSFSHYGTLTKVELVRPVDEPSPSPLHDANTRTQNTRHSYTRKKSRRRRPSFAFLTFDSHHAASLALAASSPTNTTNTPPLYTMVRPAKPPKHQTHSITKHQAQIQLALEKERTKYVSILASQPKCNLVFQVHSSHLDRWVHYLPTLTTDSVHVQVTGTIPKTGLNNISLVLIHSSHTLEFMTRLQERILDRMAWNKSYWVHPRVYSIPNHDDDTKGETRVLEYILKEMMQQFQTEEAVRSRIVFHIQAFPPKLLQRELVSTMDGLLNRLEQNGLKKGTTTQGMEWHMSPKIEECTHEISCIMLHEGIPYDLLGETVKGGEPALYMAGISPISNQWKEGKDSSSLNSDEVCRAYYKIKEAFERYALDCPQTSILFENQVAFDCGSAPGGWTQFLIQDLKCAKVYSCDPGELSPKVKQLDGVHYLQMKSDKAMTYVQKEIETSKKLIRLWVSDMCLSDMEDQANTFLQAMEKRILAPDAFFVLTLKCTTGHSKGTFDALAEKEIDRLLGKLENPRHIRNYHLFSNRRGERTVMGFIS